MQYKMALIGENIVNSFSPIIFSMFAKQYNLNLTYSKITLNDKNHFIQTVDDFFNSNGFALNITSPFKNMAYKYTKIHSMRSKFCMASNLIYKNISDNRLIADTTDGLGFIMDLKQYIDKLYNLNILIIGSGFVVDSILMDIIIENPCTIDLLARNQEKLKFLQQRYLLGEFDVNKSYDIIINTTPNIDENQIFKEVMHIEDNTICYDLSYNITHTVFLQIMQKLNSRALLINGLGMLVCQAKIAFTYLFNKTPDEKIVYQELLKTQFSRNLT